MEKRGKVFHKCTRLEELSPARFLLEGKVSSCHKRSLLGLIAGWDFGSAKEYFAIPKRCRWLGALQQEGPREAEGAWKWGLQGCHLQVNDFLDSCTKDFLEGRTENLKSTPLLWNHPLADVFCDCSIAEKDYSNRWSPQWMFQFVDTMKLRLLAEQFLGWKAFIVGLQQSGRH